MNATAHHALHNLVGNAGSLAACESLEDALMLTDTHLDQMADDLSSVGFAIVQMDHWQDWLRPLMRVAQTKRDQFKPAKIGRHQNRVLADDQRRDRIHWIERDSVAESQWCDAMEAVRAGLNRRLMMGLFSYESHFAHYAPGAFYQRHKDAFHGQSNRILSTVTYLNEAWQAQWGGQLRLHLAQGPVDVIPNAGTMVVFLSESIEHEVLPATRDRYSIAGWFRVNQSIHGRVDPSR